MYSARNANACHYLRNGQLKRHQGADVALYAKRTFMDPQLKFVQHIKKRKETHRGTVISSRYCSRRLSTRLRPTRVGAFHSPKLNVRPPAVVNFKECCTRTRDEFLSLARNVGRDEKTVRRINEKTRLTFRANWMFRKNGNRAGMN